MEQDVNDPRTAKRTLEYVLASAYQKHFLLMSLQGDKLRKNHSYPVIELYIDAATLTDPK